MFRMTVREPSTQARSYSWSACFVYVPSDDRAQYARPAFTARMSHSVICVRVDDQSRTVCIEQLGAGMGCCFVVRKTKCCCWASVGHDAKCEAILHYSLVTVSLKAVCCATYPKSNGASFALCHAASPNWDAWKMAARRWRPASQSCVKPNPPWNWIARSEAKL